MGFKGVFIARTCFPDVEINSLVLSTYEYCTDFKLLMTLGEYRLLLQGCYSELMWNVQRKDKHIDIVI